MSTHFAAAMTEAVPDDNPKRLSVLHWIAIAAGALALGILIYNHVAHPAEDHAAHHHAPPLWGLGILPFVAILASIAFLPLISKTQHWWESNEHRFLVAMLCAGATLLYAVLANGLKSAPALLDHAVLTEYIPFIMLLFSLYVISGGINLTGDLPATPLTNATFLAVGVAIASFIGTTGASMLLIRPLLQTNSERKYVVHTVVFFIFLVSNIGGCLLPIGDPPLFLGFLYGVPFAWTLGLWPQWLACCAVLLVVYFVVDSLAYRKEARKDILRDETERRPLRFRGLINIVWLAGVVFAVAFVQTDKPFLRTSFEPFPFMRELLMLGFVGLSLLTTPRGARKANNFNYAAILEVAALFIGIFIAMQIPIQVLTAYGPTLTDPETGLITQAWQYFWVTGGLSSFLDNAPTYAVFFRLGETMPLAEGTSAVDLDGGGSISAVLLVAISLGAVFMGAMTYIGNGPNFMVKAIAEQSGITMPSFFGYMFKYSIPILVPVFLLIMFIFLM